MTRARRTILATLFGVALSGCLDHGGTSPPASCSIAPSGGATGGTPQRLGIVGCGLVASRFTAEVAVRGQVAYTTTWGTRAAPGNAINVWDVSSATPVLVDSIVVEGASTLGDVAVSDDGRLLIVATERVNGSLVIFDLTDPKHPRQTARLATPDTYNGVHTAEVGRVKGTLYAVLAIDALSGAPTPASKVVIVDLSDPANPRQVFVKTVSSAAPFVHDSFLRDGILFVALWDQGLEIWDVGGGGRGGSPSAPVVMGSVQTIGGDVHNVWWLHDAGGSRRFAFVGQESAPAQIGFSSTGDIHVIDVADLANPREVAFFHVPGAGTHNFAVDEARGILYAAFYNGGVRAIDISGDLSTCTGAQQSTVGSVTRCDLGAMGRELGRGLADGTPTVYVWGVQLANGVLFASDMLNGLWALQTVQ